MGASATNFEEIIELSSQVVGLKMYLNETFTTLKLDGIQQWLKVSIVYDDIFLLRKQRKQLSLFFIFFYSILNIGLKEYPFVSMLRDGPLPPLFYWPLSITALSMFVMWPPAMRLRSSKLQRKRFSISSQTMLNALILRNLS